MKILADSFINLKRICSRKKKPLMNSLILMIRYEMKKMSNFSTTAFSYKLVYFDHPKVVPDAAGRRQNHISP